MRATRGLLLMAVASNPAQSGARMIPGGGDVLLLSMRRLADQVGYCMDYEFEDVIGEVTGADLVEAGDVSSLELSRRAYKLTRFATGSRSLARAISPRPSIVPLERDYELFFPIFNHTHELYALATIPNWRKRCRYAACFVSEVWLHLLPRYLLEQLADFDHIFLGVYHCVDEVARITGRPCSYLPLAVDVLRFSPVPQFPERAIDVYNIGRRSQVTHRALLRAAREREIFYCYDTIAASGIDQKQRTFRVQDTGEHRLQLANMLQHTRYFFANRARINEPGYTRGRDEMSGRFYEGAAAGAVMIGEAPHLDAFSQQFDWTDAVIHVPFDSPDIIQILAELDANPGHLAGIRRNNVIHAAMRHDWSHRLGTVFDTFHLLPTPAMQLREQRLQALASLHESAWPAEAAHLLIPRVSERRSPVFSVIVPTHNRAAIVGRALRSIAAQTYRDYEVIVVDDGSKDSTPEYLETVRGPRCQVIRNERSLGVSAARNRGIAVATGQWIAFLDDDDELRPEALAALYDRLTTWPNLDFLWGGRLVHEIDSAGRYIALREDDWSGVPSMVSGSSFLNLVLRIATSSAFTIRRTVLQAVGGFDEQLRVSEDRDLFIALAKHGYVGAAIPQHLMDVDETGASLSRSAGGQGGAAIDLQVINKHHEYLYRPEHQQFLDSYLVAVFAGFLRAGNRTSAMKILGELWRRRALNLGVLRQYLRHAPEFRAVKALFRYEAIRRIANRLRRSQPS
jgi:glycosyltransferase involved in cell wall biosynthesis